MLLKSGTLGRGPDISVIFNFPGDSNGQSNLRTSAWKPLPIKMGYAANSLNITWELLRHAEFHMLPQAYAGFILANYQVANSHIEVGKNCCFK